MFNCSHLDKKFFNKKIAYGDLEPPLPPRPQNKGCVAKKDPIFSFSFSRLRRKNGTKKNHLHGENVARPKSRVALRATTALRATVAHNVFLIQMLRGAQQSAQQQRNSS